ncbi:fascin domain-containing protein [Nakamurella sp. GG22]
MLVAVLAATVVVASSTAPRGHEAQMADSIGVAAAATEVVALRAKANDRYVAADNVGKAPLIANRTVIGPWETFDLIHVNSTDVYLRAHANGKFVCAEAAGASALISSRDVPGLWETFQLIKNSDGTTSLRARANNKLVTAENAGDAPLIANRTEVGEWEKFDVIALNLTDLTPTTVRDPLKQPFSSTSIWNMPIGTGAVYVPANLPSVPGGDVWSPMPQIDDDIIVLKPAAPLTSVRHSSAEWSGSNRCTGGSQILATVPIPSGFLVGNSRDNNSAAILLQDGRTIAQMQPFTRCTAGGAATSLLTFPNVDIYGDGISGSHGGSGMSALGGTIRLGELRPGQQGPRHALKVNVHSAHDLYNCSTFTDCYRWPAATADTYATPEYGTVNNNQNKAMKMGALLAIPASVDVNGLDLKSEPGRQLAWTLQNYGAYIVDSTGGPGFAIEAESGPDGSVRTQFQFDYGYPLEQRVRDNTPWSTDLQKIVALLAVVDNNSATRVGGGGTPLQPLAPPLAGP